MAVLALEGEIHQGQIRLKNEIRLPDSTKVYVLVPDLEVKQVAHIYSPRLAHREKAIDFKLTVIDEDPADASL